MHPAINQIVSRTFYFSKLTTAPSIVKARQHPMPACFVDVERGKEEFLDRSCFNSVEAQHVLALVSHCVKYIGFAPSRVNVLTFYNAQRDLLSKMAAKEHLEVDVLSVDSMQGREADVIILSCVRADVTGGLGFVADARRVNVALSRARESLIVVGSARSLEVERIWHSALKGLQRFGSARECQDALEAALPRGWAQPRQAASPQRDPKAERSSADREFEADESPSSSPAKALEQRDSGIPDDWDASDDDDADLGLNSPDAPKENWDDESSDDGSADGESAGTSAPVAGAMEGLVALHVD